MLPEQGVIGWDLGGAHLKAAAIGNDGRLLWVRQVPAPLWQGLQHLDAALDTIANTHVLAEFEHALTMTGELVDLFEDRAQGVDELTRRFVERTSNCRVRVYAGVRGFVETPRVAVAAADIASANWHATTEWLAACRPNGILIDIGSTTTDILPFAGGRVCNRGYSDRDRLAADELVYTGIVRTPVMAVVRRVPFAGDWVSVANEHFATMADVYRVLDRLPDGADQLPSADGRDKSVASSMRRLARMIGADLGEANSRVWHGLAAYIADQQLDAITSACWRQMSVASAESTPLIAAGVGKCLVRQVADRLRCDVIDIDSVFGHPATGSALASQCAPAVAVARLLEKERVACAC